MSIFRFIKQYFCKHEPHRFRALNDPVLVCRKCGKHYQEQGK